MKVSRFISMVLAVFMLCGCVTITPSKALESSDESGTFTYYFLAPQFWIDTENGAKNENVGVYYWEPVETADYPGIYMTPAPEVGENIFKAEVPKDASTVIFNDGCYELSDPQYMNTITESQIVSCEGYENDCPYDNDLNCDNFDGWIFVLNFNETTEHQMVKLKCNGAWFRLDDYKNYDYYYGSYPERKAADDHKRDISETTVFLNGVQDEREQEDLEITEIAVPFTATEKTLDIVIKDADKTLLENVDYSVEYRNNVGPGMADLDITGIGAYTGQLNYHFDIMKLVGDINGDCEVTSSDALIILRASVRLYEPSESEKILCDVDEDGDISSSDALIVLRKSVGLF